MQSSVLLLSFRSLILLLSVPKVLSFCPVRKHPQEAPPEPYFQGLDT